MSRHEVPDQEQDGHDNMLCDGDHIRSSNFQYLDLFGNGWRKDRMSKKSHERKSINLLTGVEVDMVTTNTSGDAKLQFGSLVTK
jgi:hypothetical protein